MITERPERVLPVISAQGKYPRGADPWVPALREALAALDPERIVLLSSLGLPGWDLATYLGGQSGFRMELVLPGRETERSTKTAIASAYALDPHRLTVEFSGGPEGKTGWLARDHRLFESADTILTVSVRPGGRLAGLLLEAEADGKTIRRGLETPWSASNWRPRYDFTGKMLNPALDCLLEDRLIHWTHASAGPWPGETPARYIADLLARPECYVRDACATLAHIARERKVRGSSLHMPGAECGVSLTSLTPREAVPLMRWRQRYLRYSLEPFGLAFRRSDMENLGTHPVVYLEPEELRRTKGDRFFYQCRGLRTLWSAEREWRLRGDIDFDCLSPGEPLLLASDKRSAGELNELTSGRFRVEPVFLESVTARPGSRLSDCPE